MNRLFNYIRGFYNRYSLYTDVNRSKTNSPLPSGDLILLEDGNDYLITENGDYIVQ